MDSWKCREGVPWSSGNTYTNMLSTLWGRQYSNNFRRMYWGQTHLAEVKVGEPEADLIPLEAARLHRIKGGIRKKMGPVRDRGAEGIRTPSSCAS
jgi:hypothetical protein